MINYLEYRNQENFLTHREISNFSTKTCPKQTEGIFCLMIAFYYTNGYLKVNNNTISHKYAKTLNLPFANHYINSNSKTKTNSLNFLINEEDLHAITPTVLGGMKRNTFLFVCKPCPELTEGSFYFSLFIFY